MAHQPEATETGVVRRVAGQGALLMSGFAASQVMSFARNAMLGHMLAKGDFGVAAILTLLLQLLDALTDLGVDRMIVQAPDGDEPRFVATNHSALVVRGLLIAALLVTASDPIAGFFSVPEAASAITAIALVPLIKGFQHLDARRAQRRLDNRPFLWIEVVPQAVALALTWPVVQAFPNFYAVVWLSLAQAVATLIISHSVAERRYGLAVDTAILKRLCTFGWPIWLSAFPLTAVYHGDRIVVGKFIGIEELAGYSAAFLVAMVPGL
ncbi:MAG: oligosaccharide flippase family protein, partial [Deltaproteobacteria bacterium]